ncbi:MAG: hypothetical protein NUV48_15285, partial [Peptococcaceae bacterium]|nr:hypothetical protein [Peptococcaceae bacterium]
SLSIEEILEIAQEPRPFPPFKKTHAQPGLQKLYSIAKKETAKEEKRQSKRPVTVIPYPDLNKTTEPINTTGQELLEKYLPNLQRYCPLVAKVVQEGCISHNRSVAVNAVARAFCALRMSQEEAEKLIWLIEPKITNQCGDFKTHERKDRNNWIMRTVRKSYEEGQPHNKCDYYSRRIFPSLKNTVCPGCGVKNLDSLRNDLSAFTDTALNSLKPDTIHLLGAPLVLASKKCIVWH